MGLVAWILMGLVVGVIAQLVLGDAPGGLVLTVVWGIIGALIGGYVADLVFGQGLGTFFNLQTWALALVGALVVIGGVRAVTAREP